MRAWTIREFGDPAIALTRTELPDPEPGPGELLLRMKAASLNYRDLLMLRGHYDPRQPLPLVPLSDGVGEVVAVGDGVDRFGVGDRVCPIFCQTWTGGPLDDRARKSTLGGPLDGMLRELVVVSQEGVVRPPEFLTDAEAACLPCAAVTAWRALVTEGGVRAGQTVLTLGTGGVSLFALQLGVALGAEVIVTSSSDGKLERAAALGAHHTLNYVADPAWGKTLASRADVVVELGGAGTLDQSLRAVKTGGTIALIGVLAGVKTSVALTKVLMRGVRVQGVLVGSRDDFEALCRAVALHRIRPVVDRTFAFDQAVEAFDHLASAKHFGKITIHL